MPETQTPTQDPERTDDDAVDSTDAPDEDQDDQDDGPDQGDPDGQDDDQPEDQDDGQTEDPDDDPDDESDDDPDDESEDEESQEPDDEDDDDKAGRNRDDEDRAGRDRYEREEWEQGAAPDDSTVVEYQRLDAEALFLSGRPCSDPNCQNTHNPAEDAWIKLVSAIPVAGQVASLTVVTTGTPAPSQDDIRTLVNEVRPDEPDKYALREVSAHWQTFKEDFDADPESGIAPNLKASLRTLSEHWKGADFDAFAEQVEIVIGNCATVSDDIGDTSSGAVGLLEQKADEFYGLQGGDSGELPYPAPLYWISDMEQLYTDPFVHVRPPFSNGDCQITAGCDNDGGLIGALLELGGFNKDYVDEVSDYVENQTEYYLNKGKKLDPPTTPEQAALWAQADANNNISADVNAGVEDYDSRSQIANEDVVNRWENAEESAGTFTPEAHPSNPSNFREAGDMLAGSYSGLDAGSNGFNAGDEPPGGGSGAGGGLEPPGGGGAGGGLASGSTLGGGGSFPVGAASSTGEGAGGGSGAGSGSGGRGAAAGMGGMMGGGAGGGRGMGGDQPSEGEHSDWLEEDQEIWGIRDIDEDPYA
ncbi:hypothetical protein [Glycomyces harbinensis]|uniref:Uncharacterized protein n=1 Tax=Glycomyces harbinensis TaxID=58114 RepID=A0A1G6Y6P0_9ACTN|nr:hypothetical protein [Glycomyces harbinensis]SDD85265.1 hypothetical protein SAMN05216270_108129 [Glycomyces harbinensis]